MSTYQPISSQRPPIGTGYKQPIGTGYKPIGSALSPSATFDHSDPSFMAFHQSNVALSGSLCGSIHPHKQKYKGGPFKGMHAHDAVQQSAAQWQSMTPEQRARFGTPRINTTPAPAPATKATTPAPSPSPAPPPQTGLQNPGLTTATGQDQTATPALKPTATPLRPFGSKPGAARDENGAVDLNATRKAGTIVNYPGGQAPAAAPLTAAPSPAPAPPPAAPAPTPAVTPSVPLKQQNAATYAALRPDDRARYDAANAGTRAAMAPAPQLAPPPVAAPSPTPAPAPIAPALPPTRPLTAAPTADAAPTRPTNAIGETPIEAAQPGIFRIGNAIAGATSKAMNNSVAAQTATQDVLTTGAAHALNALKAAGSWLFEGDPAQRAKLQRAEHKTALGSDPAKAAAARQKLKGATPLTAIAR